MSNYLLRFSPLFLIQLTRTKNYLIHLLKKVLENVCMKKWFVCVNFLKSKKEYVLDHLEVIWINNWIAKNVLRANYMQCTCGPQQSDTQVCLEELTLQSGREREFGNNKNTKWKVIITAREGEMKCGGFQKMVFIYLYSTWIRSTLNRPFTFHDICPIQKFWPNM